jgi:hypothetical protein
MARRMQFSRPFSHFEKVSETRKETKMKSMTSKLLTLAATLAIAATTASAQVTLKAAVPFSFEISGHQVLPAGSYSVRREGHVWQFTNVDTRNKALAPATVGMESKRTDEARMVFQCHAGNCALRNIQTGHGEMGAYWPAPKRSKSDADELARTVIVPLTVSAE